MSDSNSEQSIPLGTQKHLNSLFTGELEKYDDAHKHQLLQQGSIIEMGFYDPLAVRDNTGNVVGISYQFFPQFEAFIKENIKEKESLLHKRRLGVSRRKIENKYLSSRLITYQEYLELLQFDSESIYQKKKPVSKMEYMAEYDDSAPFYEPKPERPIRGHYEDSYSYADAVEVFNLELKSWEASKRFFEHKKKQRKKEKEKEYYNYVDQIESLKIINHKVAKSLPFRFIRKHVNYEYFLDNNPPTMEGYIRFLGNLSKRFKFLRPWYLKQKCFVPIDLLIKHVYVTGSTGSGKTELLKFLIHQIVKTKDKGKVPRSLIVIEPDGKMTSELARHKDFPKNDLFYFSAELDSKRVEDGKALPSYNLFDFPHDGEEAIDKYAQSLAQAFQEISTDFTPNMELVAKNCFHVLIRRKGATLHDFQILLDKNRNEQLVEYGKRNPIKAVRDFFSYQFDSPNLEPTRRSLMVKVANLFTNTTFARVVSNPKSSFDLEHIANNGGVALFSMAGLGDDGGKVLGTLLIARLRQIAFSRPNPENLRPETFLVVDEFQEYVGRSIEKILIQGRKFRISLVLASQFIGQGMDTETRKAVLSCTNTKIAGVNDGDNFRALKVHLGIDSDEFKELRKGNFYLSSTQLAQAQKRACKIQIPTWYLDRQGEVSKEEWNALLKEQKNAFYLAGDELKEDFRKSARKKSTSQKTGFKYNSFE